MAEIITFRKRKDIEADKTADARLVGLDALRGLSVMGMICVAYAGDWTHRFGVLNHADWHGLAVADLIFPAFLFCAGAVIPVSLARRSQDKGKGALAGHVVLRMVALFALGLFLNLLPGFDFAHVRIMGILQRIALAYGAVSLFCLAVAKPDGGGVRIGVLPLFVAALVLGLGYEAVLHFWNMPGCGPHCFDSSHSLPTVIDRAVLTVPHMWPYGLTDGQVTYDPEGFLSTLGAIVNVLIGAMAGLYVQQRGVKGAIGTLALCGLALVIIGLGLDGSTPIIKKIWTPSFAVYSAGTSLLFYALLSLVTDVWNARAWATPLRVFGANATLAFVGITLLDVVAQLPLLAGKTIHDQGTAALEAVIPDARVASVTYSLILLLILLAALWPLYSKRIFVKI